MKQGQTRLEHSPQRPLGLPWLRHRHRPHQSGFLSGTQRHRLPHHVRPDILLHRFHWLSGF